MLALDFASGPYEMNQFFLLLKRDLDCLFQFGLPSACFAVVVIVCLEQIAHLVLFWFLV